MSRLTRAEKEALLSIAKVGFIAWHLGIGRTKGREMVTRLVRKGMLRRGLDGTPSRYLTRKGRAVARAFAPRAARPLARYAVERANPKAGRSHIARKLVWDGYGFLIRSNEFDPEMRP